MNKDNITYPPQVLVNETLSNDEAVQKKLRKNKRLVENKIIDNSILIANGGKIKISKKLITKEHKRELKKKYKVVNERKVKKDGCFGNLKIIKNGMYIISKSTNALGDMII